MKQKIVLFLLTAIFVFSQVNFVEAKGSVGGRSGGSFSSGRSSFSSSKSSGGYSGSSSSKSFGGSGSSSSSKSSGGYSGSSSKSSGYSSGSSAKSSGGYSGSSSSGSSRSVPGSGSYGGSSSSGSSSGSSKSSGFSGGTSSRSSTLKSSYMQDTYKKQMSSANYNAYKQNLNTEQRRVYDTAGSTNYTVRNRMNFDDAIRTRPQRINVYSSRPTIINVNTSMFGGPLSYGSAFVGPWDLWFLMRASDLFWYHHWTQIYPYRDYFAAAQFADMEARIHRLEQQNIVRNSNYLEPGVDPDLQFSPDYQQNHLDNLYYTNKYSSPGTHPVTAVVVLLIVVIVLILIIRRVSRPRRKTYNSGIY